MELVHGLLAKLKGEIAFIVLVTLGIAGGCLYVRAEHYRADRDDVLHRVEIICAHAGRDFAGVGNVQRGAACADTVAGLAGFKAKSDQLTAQTLADAMAAHDARQLTDNQAARAAAEAAQSAALRMETADAEAERRNLVDREWFAAVNGVAGLRAARAN